VIRKFLFLTLLLSGPLSGAPLETASAQEIRLSLEQIGRQLHSQAVEIALFQEQVLGFENSLRSLKQDLKTTSPEKGTEKRLSTLEKANEALICDFKTLKNSLNETSSTITHCQTQLNKLEKQVSTDIQNLKNMMQSMLALLQGEARSYIVQPGDSLGQIALQHKTDIKTLKKLNNLSSDTIFSGQKIILP